MLSLRYSRYYEVMIIYLDKYISFELVFKKGLVCNKILKIKMFSWYYYILWVFDIVFILIVFKLI